MKKLLISAVLLSLSSAQLLACDLCQKKQPKILQDITHGPGPQGNGDYIIIWVAIVIVAITLGLSIKFLVWPKEKNKNHIKYIVVNRNALNYER